MAALTWWRVKPGLTMKMVSRYLPALEGESIGTRKEYWREPTDSLLVGWIPAPVPESSRKYEREQASLLHGLRVSWELPGHYFESFGSLVLLYGLMSAFISYAGVLPVPDGFLLRTDTFNGDRRVSLAVEEETMSFVSADFKGARIGNLGVMALGIEKVPPQG